MQNSFGYDKNKADIACAKFGEENLKGENKHQNVIEPMASPAVKHAHRHQSEKHEAAESIHVVRETF